MKNSTKGIITEILIGIICVIGLWLTGYTIHKKIIVNVEQVDIRLELKGD